MGGSLFESFAGLADARVRSVTLFLHTFSKTPRIIIVFALRGDCGKH
jgi:hypothetical protein